MKRTAVFVTTLLCLLATAAHAQTLPTAKPEDVGMSSERLARIAARLRTDAEKGVIPGSVLLVARNGRVAMFEASGLRDPQTKAPMTKDAIFRIYSMSKPITSVSAMLLFEEGKLTLDQPVSRYIPALGKLKVGVEKTDAAGSKTLELVDSRRDMSIQDLLRHTSGLTYGFFGDSLVKKEYQAANPTGDYPTNAEMVERLAKLPLAYQPGTTWDYSYSTDVLGRLIEVVGGTTLYQFQKERLLDPLGMKDTMFYVTDPARQARIAEPFKDDRSIGVGAEFNDPRVVQKWESGGGGTVSTASDYLRFAEMLRSGGKLGSAEVLGRGTVALVTADHLPASFNNMIADKMDPAATGYGFGLGVAVRRQDGIAAMAGSAGDFYWSGVYGTYFWVDPKEQLTVVFMAAAPGLIRLRYRQMMRNLVYQTLT